MKQATGDLWTVPADARVITTNGYVKKNGLAVMGRGVAQQAARRYRWLPTWLGRSLACEGNHVLVSGMITWWLATFPVKHNWWEKADLILIERSAHELIVEADRWRWKWVCLPRPGCGNGGLSWEVVEPLLTPILDDRFVVVYPGD